MPPSAEPVTQPRWGASLIAFAATFAFGVALIAGVQIAVDPYEAWGTPIVPGFNNFKAAQEDSARMFKRYEYARIQPKVVLFGTSRLNYSTPATWPGVDDDDVYNFGLNGVQLREEFHFVVAAVQVHKPQIIVVGVDLLQFNRRWRKPTQKPPLPLGPHWASRRGMHRVNQIIETVFNYNALMGSWQTLNKSQRNPNRRYHERGWDTQRLVKLQRRNRYRQNLYHYHNGAYRNFKRDPSSLRAIGQLVRYAKRRGIEVHLYISPVGVDFLHSYEINGLWDEFEEMKRELVTLGPVMDFGTVNHITSNRQNYLDPSHYYPKVGDLTLRVTHSGVPNRDFGVALTPQNIDSELRVQRENMSDWIDQNAVMDQALRELRAPKQRTEFLSTIRPVTDER